MSKENFTIPLDNLLRRYRRDRQWLAILCRLDYKVFNKFLQDEKTTYGQLQEMLARGGITLKISIQGEDPVPDDAKRLQFLLNIFKNNQNKAIFEATKVTNAPYCWFQQDDIELRYLKRLENYFVKPYLWTFSGLSETPDIMKSKVLKSDVDFRLLPPETVERFRQNAASLYPEGIPNELITQAVQKDLPKASDMMKKQNDLPSDSDKAQEIPAEAASAGQTTEPAAAPAAPAPPAVENPAPEKVPEKKPTTIDKYVRMNESAIAEIIDKTGFDRTLAGGIVYPGLIKEALSETDRKAFEDKDREIRETIELYKQSHRWLFALLAKKNHKDRDIFSMTKTDFTEACRKEREKHPDRKACELFNYGIGFLCEAFAESGLDFTLRFVNDPRPGTAYTKYKTGFIRKYIEKKKPDDVNKGFVDKLYSEDDLGLTDMDIQSICDGTGEPVVIYMHRKGATTFAAEDSYTFYPNKAKTKETETAKKENKPKPEQKPDKAAPTPKKPQTKPARPSAAEWLSKQEGFNALKDRLGAGATILDGRYGEDTVDACFPYTTPEDVPFALMSLGLKKAIRSGEVAADTGKEPDFDTRMLISSNRTVTDCIECMDQILGNLRLTPGHETIVLAAPMTTTTGEKATAVSLNAEGGLDVTIEQKGFLGKKSVTRDGGTALQYRLFGTFTKEQWYKIAKTAKENYRKYVLERYSNRIREATETQQRAIEAVERAIGEIRASIVSLIREADGTGLFDDFAVMSDDCLFDNPSFQDGHARFVCTKPQGESHPDETEIPVGSLREINEHLIEHLKKKLEI